MAVEAKRARLEGVAATSIQSRAEWELAGVLERLLSVGGDESGLDALLEELGRAQAGLNGSAHTHAAFKAIADAQQKLQAAIVALQAAVDRYTPPPGYQPPPSSGVDAAYVRGLLSYAHRLSYSSAAPLGFQPGQPLFFFKPPAPQEAEMRASQLHAFSREWEERQQALEAQRAAAARGAVAPGAAVPALAAPASAAPAGGDLASLAAKHGLDVQQLLASIPPGWKPGDPIPLGPAAAAGAAPGAAAAAPAAAAPAAAAPAAAVPAAAAAAAAVPAEAATEAAVPVEEAEAAPAPRLAGIFLNQMDFADLEYGVSSGEDDSDDDSDEDSD
ncbi:hypothetical protein ABPG75_013266 [Micractinium tetrahymenae]